jgi:putative two-component system response regulator
VTKPADSNRPLVLVAEDDPTSAAMLRELVSAAGYRCQVVTDGEAAVRAGQTTRPDLILLDLRIPGLNGFEACEQLKSDPRTAHIPIVVVTGFGEEHCRLRALEAGADDFLTKPVNRADLYARIRSLLRLSRCLASRESPDAVCRALFAIIELHDPALALHCQTVSHLAAATARYAGMDADEVRLLELAGLIHDLGKVPAAASHNCTNPPEHDLPHRDETSPTPHPGDDHPQKGEHILSFLGPTARLAPLVRGHHERWDGSGFPDGLPATAQTPSVQVLAAANIWAHILSRSSDETQAAAALADQIRRGGINPTLQQPLLLAASHRHPRGG